MFIAILFLLFEAGGSPEWFSPAKIPREITLIPSRFSLCRALRALFFRGRGKNVIWTVLRTI